MSAIVVDTSSWITFFKELDHPAITDALQEGRVLLAPVVASELLSAKLNPLDHKKMVDFLTTLEWVTTPPAHWLSVGELRRNLSKHGLHVSTPDAHVAQCAIDTGAFLISEDKIFSKMKKYIPLKLA